jgi:hypothetical protein
MTWRDVFSSWFEAATVGAAAVFAGAILIYCAAALVEVWSAPRLPSSPYSDCLARCEALFDVDHRPAGWVVLDPEPCTCGVVLEVDDA